MVFNAIMMDGTKFFTSDANVSSYFFFFFSLKTRFANNNSLSYN